MLTLPVQTREQTGKQVRKIRRQGQVPAVLYGPKIKPTLLQVDYKTLARIYQEAGESTLINLDFGEGGKENGQQVVFIREAAQHPITQKFMHIDFYQALMDEKIEIRVPLEYEGEAPAVKNEGGVLVRNIYEIDIRALPKDIPHAITVSLSGFEHIDDFITAKELPIAPGVEILQDPETIICLIEAPREEEEEAPAGEEAEAAEEEAISSIKTEGEEKREEAEEQTQETPA